LAVRIYALAKELKLDSKELVDICTNAGLPGKGSALASLTDEEADRVRLFVRGDGGMPRTSAAVAAAPQRPSEPVRTGKMPVIVTPKPAPVQPASAGPESPPQPAEADQPLAASVEPTPALPAAPRPAGPLAAAVRRESYIGTGAKGKVPTVGADSKPSARKKGDGPSGSERTRPAIKLAPMPTPSMPTGGPVHGEPKAQKPDMKLPADVLGGKLGSKPLAAHLRRHERTLETERDRKSGPAAGAAAGKGARPPIADSTAARARPRRGKAATGTAEEEPVPGKPMLGGREQRQLQRRRNVRTVDGEEVPTRPRSFNRRQKRAGANTAAPRKEHVTIQLPCSVRELSESAGIQAAQIQRVLLNYNVMAKITDVIDAELTELVVAELGLDVEFTKATSLEEQVIDQIESQVDDAANLVSRPPVVTFLGHVDHGKTSLLDRIIGLNVVSGESGGITQHIRAYSIEKDGKRLSFVDTPGHEAFTEMRARGANVTDIAVLVVAADDGVMPQTEEAISHARAAEVPIIVALNKVDLPGLNLDRVYTSLSTNELQPSEWGGDVELVKTSATKGTGIEELLDTILTVAELHEYKANPNRPAIGTCLEAQQDSDRGVVAKVLVQNGTLRPGDVFVCGQSHGRVKAMYDTIHTNQRVAEAGPSIPVNITGFDVAPGAGDRFYVLDDIAQARQIAESRFAEARVATLGGGASHHVTLETLFERLDGAEEIQTLNLILRADVRGSIEAIEKEFSKLEHPEVKIKLLQKSVGGITEADVTLADASDAIILGFNVVPDEKARLRADERGVQIRRYDVIYKITDDLRDALEGMLKPEERELELGRALVQQVFKISRVGTIAGCRVISGVVERSARARIIRDSTIIGDYSLDTLRREKDDAKEVREGYECGIKLAGFNDIKEGDVLEIYKVEEIQRKFDA
jgi:translation initiation factor IF-2